MLNAKVSCLETYTFITLLITRQINTSPYALVSLLCFCLSLSLSLSLSLFLSLFELIYCRNGVLNTVGFNRLPAQVHPRFLGSFSPLHEYFSDDVFSQNASALTFCPCPACCLSCCSWTTSVRQSRSAPCVV